MPNIPIKEPKGADNQAAKPQPENPAANDDAGTPEEAEQMAKPDANDDPVFAEYGEPFITNKKGQVHLNERALAVKCASDHLVRYDPGLKTYERYENERGLWLPIHEVEVRRLLSDLLLKLGDEWNQQEFVQRNKTSQLNSLTKMLQSYQVEVASEDTTGLFHVANGVLDLRGKTPRLLDHDPKYPFKYSSGIKYDPKANARQFTEELLPKVLGADDIALLQKYLGSTLRGPNSCHGLLLIRGPGGGGKSTLVTIFEKVLGENIVAQLRTQHLPGRFETSAFLGKRVLVGKDVFGDTLMQKGAQMLKSLTGGDLLHAEIKYNPTKQPIRGDYHVVITSNNRLRIALDGDEDAWGRRLLIVDYENEKPKKPIPDFADRLVAKEGSGILNWLIQGAAAYRKDMDKKGRLDLTDKQQQRVADLLYDSDSVRSFVEQCITKKEGSNVSSEELTIRYHKVCTDEKWTPVSGHEFQTRLPDLLCQRFHICRRNDITREGSAVRGYKGLALN